MLHRSTNAALFALVMFTAACAVPLGPGFYIEKELLEVRFVPGSPPHLEIRATFTLKNSGNAPLDALDLSLPAEKDFGAQNVRITVDGTAVSPHPLAADSPDVATVRISFPAAWAQKSKHALAVSYSFAASASGQHLGLSEDSFYLSTRDWFPLPLAPKGLFAEGDKHPKVFNVSVFVPPDFFVHAAGHPYGRKRRATETEYRFRLREGEFSPFVVAGRYHEQKFSDSNGTVIFWTYQSLPADQVARAGRQLAATLKTYETAFGPRAEKSRPVWVAETTALPCGTVDVMGLCGLGLPDSVLHYRYPSQETLADAGLMYFTEILLPGTWFYQVTSPAPDQPLPIDNALANYAQRLAAEARGDVSVPHSLILSRLKDFDDAVARLQEPPSRRMLSDDSYWQFSVRSAKADLFLMAIEEQVGGQTLQRAVRHVVQSLRGKKHGYIDLRVALEAESGKNLGEFFRLWLNQPGIPADFRARYSSH
jgi:hypothetical protein